MRMRIRTKIMLYFVFITIFAITSLTIIIVLQGSHKMKENTITQFEKIAKEEFFLVGKVLEKAQLDTMIIAENSVIADPGLSREKKTEELIRAKNTLAYYDDITLVSTEGVVIASTDYSFRGDWKHKKVFKDALQGNYSMSNVHMIPDPLKTVIVFSGPVKSQEGEISAVVSLQMEMNVIWNLTDHMRMGETGFSFILDGNDKYIAAPNKDLILTKPDASLINQIASGVDSLEYEHNGSSMIGSYYEDCISAVGGMFVSGDDSNWKLIVVQGKGEVFGLISEFGNQAFFIALAIVFIIGALGLRFSGKITEPVRALAEGAKILGDGDLCHRVNIDAEDEIGDLALSFNKMAQHLQESNDAQLKALYHLRSVNDTIPDAVIIHNKDGETLSVNKTFFDMFGYSEEDQDFPELKELFGKGYSIEKAYGLIERTLEGESVEEDWVCRRRNGEEFPVSVRLAKMTIDDCDYILSVVTDISRSKSAEDSLMDYMKRLGIINRIIAESNLAENLDNLLEGVLRVIIEEMDFDVGDIYIVEDEGRTAVLRCADNVTGDFREMVNALRTEDSPNKTVFKEGKTLYLDNIEIAKPEWHKKGNLNVLSSVPIISREGVIGALNAGSTIRKEIREEEIILLKAIGVEIGIGIARMIAEEKSKESEMKFRTIFENANDAIFLMDRNVFIECNYKTEEIFGCKKEDILNKSPYYFSPEYQPDGRKSLIAAKEYIDKAIKGYSAPFEWVHSKLDGTVFDAEVSLNRIEISGKTFLQAIVRDITERKKAERELKKSEEMFRSYFELPLIGFCLTSPEKGWLAVNRKLCDMLGYSLEELKTKTWADLTPEEDFKTEIEEYERVLKGKVDSNIVEKKYITKHGELIDVFVATQVVRKEDGTVDYLVSLVLDVTEKKRYEENLRESEEKFRALAEFSYDVIMRFDRDLKHVYVNEIVEDYTGIRAEEFIGKDHSELGFPKELVELWEASINEVFQTGKTKRVEFLLPSGIWLDWLLMPEHDANGEVNHVITSARDITERRNADEELRKSEQRFRELYQTLRDGSAAMDIEGHFIDFNKQFADMLGYTYDELKKLTHNDITTTRWHDSELCIIENQVLKRGYSDLYEKEYRRKDGSVFPVELQTYLIKDSEGNHSGYRAFVRDITERKNTEAALKMSEERFRITAIKTGQLLYDYDIESEGIVWNGAIEKITGYREEEFSSVGIKEWERMMHPDDRGSVLADLNKALQSLSEFDSEYRFRRKDGTYIYVENHGAVIPDDENSTLRMLGTINDISARKKVEERARRLNEELEMRVRERTSKLEETNADLESFSYSVSHDLRAPLRAIAAYSKILNEEYGDSVDDKMREILDIIRGRVSKMGKLIDDLLAFSRIGRREKHYINVDMENLVLSAFEEVAESGDEDVRFIVKNIPQACCDKVMIQRALENILSNSLKFTRTLEERVVEVGGWSEENRTVCYIKDNGVGFNMKYYDRLFEVFQRLHGANEFEGTGVGLALVKKVIQKHNGEVWAESEQGKGTTVYFSLPKISINTK